MGRQSRLWCFTNFNLDFDYQKVLNTSTAEYIITGKETCPTTGNLHHQGFIYFSGQRKASKNKDGKWFNKNISKMLGGCHTEMCEGNLDQNCDYCSKDDNVTEYGVKPAQGHRTDLDAIKSSILNGEKKVDDIACDNPNLFHQYGRTLNKLEDIALRKKYRTTMTKGVWYWGETDVGKSHTAFHEAFNHFSDSWYMWPKDGQWWDGYQGEKLVIINEFRGTKHIQYDELLDLVDKWPKMVSRRNREPAPFLAEKVIITSKYHPEDCYSDTPDGDECEQLLRRFEVIELTKASASEVV